MNVAIIGAGPLGRWLALRAAQAGYSVTLEDVMPGALHHAREYVRERLGEQAQGAGVQFVSTIEDAARTADLIIDCVPDELESKLEILWLLDRMAPPRTIFATPTAHLSIADLAACTYRAPQCIAIAAAPTALAELETQPGAAIALQAALATSPETIELVSNFWRKLGFDPKVNRE